MVPREKEKVQEDCHVCRGKRSPLGTPGRICTHPTPIPLLHQKGGRSAPWYTSPSCSCAKFHFRTGHSGRGLQRDSRGTPARPGLWDSYPDASSDPFLSNRGPPRERGRSGTQKPKQHRTTKQLFFFALFDFFPCSSLHIFAV